MKRFWILLLACGCLQAAGVSQETGSNGTVDVAAIAERGRAIYAYDQAAWHGTDAIFALKPETKGLAHYICTRTPSGWRVAFPRWNDAHDQLVIIYEAQETAGKFAAHKLDKPAVAEGDFLAKERALELAIADFPKPNRPYNTAIVPAADGNLYVYLYPGQTKDSVWPIGGDVRYTISSDGKSIVEKRQLHKAILDMEAKDKQAAGYHTHAISEVPEDTDVFYVLNRKPAMPEFIATPKQMFIIDKDGNIETGKN